MGTARLRGSGLLAPRHRMATVACSMPASVYSRVARKRKMKMVHSCFSQKRTECKSHFKWFCTSLVKSLALALISPLQVLVPHPFVLTNIHTVNESSSGGKPYIGGSIRQNECPSGTNSQHPSPTSPHFRTLPSLTTPG